MPELPDVTVYLEALEPRILRATLERLRLVSPFVLRSVDPPIQFAEGRRVTAVRRLGKRIVFALDASGRAAGESLQPEPRDELFVVIHLMIAGRFRWHEGAEKRPGPKARLSLAFFDFSSGTLEFTEAGTKKRASLHLVRGEAGLAAHDPGGLDVLASTPEQFADALGRENHTLKRALTDPRLFSGIGNAYSDEILHRARMSPAKLTRSMTGDDARALHQATRATLLEWIDRLRKDCGEGFPEKVTAFRKDMAVHGRYGQPCPRCGAPIQRIIYAENEANYCARCQTGGRLLADRSLSRLLKDDWPKTLDDLERRTQRVTG